ncbi:MAG: membrane-bound lytic murein transglycosylase MltF [Halioglobus sp.]
MLRCLKKFCALSISLLSMTLLGACDQGDSLDQIRTAGEISIVTRNGPTTYFIDKSGPTGFEFALANALAEDLGVDLRMDPQFSLGAIFRMLRRNEVDLAAAGLTLTDRRAKKYPHTEPYYRLKPQVIYVAGTYRPKKPEDMLGMSIAVLAGSSHADALESMRDNGLEKLEWEEVKKVSSTELLSMVAQHKVDLAILDSNEFEVQQGIYPRLRVAFDFGEEQQLTWFLPPELDNKRLIDRVNGLFARLEESGEMEKLRELHFGHASTVSRMGSHTFSINVNKKLPKYRELITQVAQEYQLDWELLAAIAYQESHWDPLATSPTGVRGMMMLTRPTAKELGVENRLDPLQSLRGGARYLKNIKRRLPQDILEPDITYMAMAAYNVGMGHLEDARVLTQRQGGNPDLWTDVMKRLPLLQDSKYYKKARYGYARGSEPVTYVQNIRHYYSVLQWEGISQNTPRPPIQVEQYLPGSIRASKLSAL